MDASLVVLAAGMGSRYGGLKQLDTFGPNGETIIDYSIFDAIRAGVTKVVFVVRESFKDEFRDIFTRKLGDRVDLQFVAQEMDNLPPGFTPPGERTKPWGTAQAVWVTKDVVKEPFIVINGDDFYGRDGFMTCMEYFRTNTNQTDFAVVSYLLKNTLSEHGAVNRGICYQDASGFLEKIVETLSIHIDKNTGMPVYPDGKAEHPLDPMTLVSMNMFAFYPSYFDIANRYFESFLEASSGQLKAEFFIPLVLDRMIADGRGRVKVLTSTGSWFGVTYKEDKPFVMEKIQALLDQGIYPQKLWA